MAFFIHLLFQCLLIFLHAIEPYEVDYYIYLIWRCYAMFYGYAARRRGRRRLLHFD